MPFNSFLGCDMDLKTTYGYVRAYLSIPFWDATGPRGANALRGLRRSFNSFLGCDLAADWTPLVPYRTNFQFLSGMRPPVNVFRRSSRRHFFQFLSGMRLVGEPTSRDSMPSTFNSFLGCDEYGIKEVSRP